MNAGEKAASTASPKNYYFMVGGYIFVLQELGPHKCRWRFIHIGKRKEWTAYEQGLAYFRRKTDTYRELAEHQVMHQLLGGEPPE